MFPCTSPNFILETLGRHSSCCFKILIIAILHHHSVKLLIMLIIVAYRSPMTDVDKHRPSLYSLENSIWKEANERSFAISFF
ncbi:hypothetical protein ACJIZ3_000859 [Penstemon smallii]|uniref:Uncharacterized protein n=1 Tax=Penstemon smallii TaxID=265156 RepID=A0ABD3U200_9LAMI